eukprot:TRINITY_DN1149_c0_g3_i1.p1 TRINITY_DN1149_c0_g3~~TRINITY_DN1149_c0_g3_i1.p1  ORF type:complete len:704 (-),score=164.67 TRINITY_DN1149_c0_g3_i1:44-2050(-)
MLLSRARQRLRHSSGQLLQLCTSAAAQRRLYAPLASEAGRDARRGRSDGATHGKHSAGNAASASAAAGAAAAAAAVAMALGLSPAGSVRCDGAGAGKATRLFPKDLERLTKASADNPIPVVVPPPFPGLAKQQWSQRHVAPIFGLPMRGKGHVARELKHYIEFFHGARAQVFEIGECSGPEDDEKLFKDMAEFLQYSGQTLDAYSFEQKGKSSGGFAILQAGDNVDSTKSMWSAHSKWHRRWMAKTLRERLGADMTFIQISVDEATGDEYVRDLAQFRGKNYEEMRKIIDDYNDHYVPLQADGSEDDVPYISVLNYNEKILANRTMQSFVGAEVCHYLSNLHPYKHTIYLSRHGESEFNRQKRIGGDSGLSARGVEYARRLAEFSTYVICGQCTDLVCVTLSPDEVDRLREQLSDQGSASSVSGVHSKGDWSSFGDACGGVVKEGMHLVRFQVGYGNDFEDAPDSVDGFLQALKGKTGLPTLVFVSGEAAHKNTVPGRLWTSSLRRTIETAAFIDHGSIVTKDGKPWEQMRGRQFRNMDEVYAGEYDGLTEAEIMRRAPHVIEDRKRDKLGFRYPRGESYYDVLSRLEGCMTHLERIREPILLISHQAVLRLILGWLTKQSRDDVLGISIPQHEVIKISYDGLGGPRIETRFPLGPEKLKDDGQGRIW